MTQWVKQGPHVCGDVWAPLPAHPDGHQSCRCCGVAQQVVWTVPDEVWAQVREPWRSHTLCLECFTARLPGYAPFSLTVLVHPGLTAPEQT